MKIDLVRIYNYALSPSEIHILINNTISLTGDPGGGKIKFSRLF
jgi:hypothetical protein